MDDNPVVLVHGVNNMSRCTKCKRNIPKGVQRLQIFVSITYDGRITRKNICGLCLLEITKELNKDEAEQWQSTLVADKL
jgi:hypothetical protein